MKKVFKCEDAKRQSLLQKILSRTKALREVAEPRQYIGFWSILSRHCEEQSDEAIQSKFYGLPRSRWSLAMTESSLSDEAIRKPRPRSCSSLRSHNSDPARKGWG